MDDDFRQAALDYHRLPRPGKLAIEATKRMATQRDLALAYSPGVAGWRVRRSWPTPPPRGTSPRGAIWSRSSPTARRCWGWGAIGPLAGKPVMEGKAALFKKFAGIDVFDIEVDANDPDLFISVVAGAGTYLRGDQSGGHQGAGVLCHRNRAACTDENPGLPR